MERDFIHIKMHHGGSFSMEGPLTYDGGEVSIFRNCDSERTFYFRLVRMAKDVGFKDGDELYYTVPGCSLDEGIDLVHDDNSVRKMLNFAKKHNFAEIYVNHKGHESASANPNPRPRPDSNKKLPAEVLHQKKLFFCMHYFSWVLMCDLLIACCLVVWCLLHPILFLIYIHRFIIILNPIG